MATYTFENSRGLEFEIVPVSVLLLQRIQTDLQEQFEEEGKTLTPPQYCTELPGGAQQCFEHDEDSISDPSTSKEEKKEWEDYLKNTAEFNALIQDKYIGAMVMDQPDPQDDEWEAKLRWLEMRIPENPLDKKMLYYTSYVLVTGKDIEEFTMRIIEISMSGVEKERVEEARKMFRSGLQGGE
jgi:hypothetical protein